MRTVQEATISCASEPGQFAALAAVTGSQQAVTDAREHYRANLAAATRLLDSRHIGYLNPGGTFYLWIDMSHISEGDVATWAERLPQDGSCRRRARQRVRPVRRGVDQGEPGVRACATAGGARAAAVPDYRPLIAFW